MMTSHQLRCLVPLLILACAVALDVKILGGPAEEHRRRSASRHPGEVPREQSRYVRRVAREGEEISLNPGGSVESVLVATDADVEISGLSAAAETSTHQDRRHFFKNNEERSVNVKITKSRAPLRRDGTAEEVILLATGTADVTLHSGFEAPNFLVGATMTLSSCAESESSDVTLTMSAISVTASATGQASPLASSIDGACTTTTFVPSSAGELVFSVEVQGTTSEDTFERTGVITVIIVEPLGEVEEVALLNDVSDADYAAIKITGSGTSAAGVRKVVGSAKLAGYNAGGKNTKDIAFAQHMVDVQVAADGSWTAELKMHGAWLSRKGFTKSNNFELRDLSLEDVTGAYVVIAEADAVSVDVDDTLTLPAKKNEIDDEMRKGKKPPKDGGRRAAGGKLLLVHGYCSGDAWSQTGAFSDFAKFQDFNANRDHDTFATMIANFGAQYPSFGIVAHSQGGAAALHLYTYYWSGLDYADPGRLIQSVGTPYQGTALAGNAAVLGQIFGVGCGTNYDLTYSGASSWLAGIPSWARAAVNYYTTSFEDRWWAYDYCNLVTDVLLSDPDDGTTEKAKGQLSGAVNRGHEEGWCHTGSMRDPSQTTDSGRNSQMNSYAAR